MIFTKGKIECLKRLSNEKGIISALAIDQRGALKKMMGEQATVEQIEAFKALVSEQLTPYASSILLDPEYGLQAASVRDANAGLLLAYEKTGYDANAIGRLPDSLDVWSVKRLKEQGIDACKFLLYYNVDDADDINEKKKAYIERIGSECVAEDVPFFLEILTYDNDIEDNTSIQYAKVKPHKVIGAMKEFSKEQYNVDVLKVEVPVNMAYVEGFAKDVILYSKEQAATYFKDQDEATHLPYIYLSAGVSAELFQETLYFAHRAGASFNGVLCGRATWSGAVKVFVQDGIEATVEWLKTTGRSQIEALNRVLEETACSWKDKQ